MSEELIHIIQQCKKRDDKHAYYQLYRACYADIFNIVVRYMPDHGDQSWMLNKCFAKIALNLHHYDPHQPFHAWMRRVVINEILDYLRKQSRRKRAESAAIHNTPHQPPTNNGIDQLELQDLLRLIHRLPQRTREVFNLYAIDGYKHDEIAKMLHISVGTSKWHLNHARTLLQQWIRQLYPEWNICKKAGQ